MAYEASSMQMQISGCGGPFGEEQWNPTLASHLCCRCHHGGGEDQVIIIMHIIVAIFINIRKDTRTNTRTNPLFRGVVTESKSGRRAIIADR